MNTEIIILGSNETAYTLAREYYELYNKKAKIYTNNNSEIMLYTKIASIYIIPDLFEENKFLKTLKEFYFLKQNDRIIIIPTELIYIDYLNKIKDKLNENFIINIPSTELLSKLTNRDELKKELKNKIEIADTEKILEQETLYEISAFLDQNSKTKLISFSQVAVKSSNNVPIVITSSYDELGLINSITEKMSNFLEELNFKGFIQILLKRNNKIKDYQIVKINPLITATSAIFNMYGINRLKIIVDDLINNKEIDKMDLKEQYVLHMIPYFQIRSKIKSILLKQQTFYLIDNGKAYNPLKYKGDKSFGRIIAKYLVNKKFRNNMKVKK